MPYRHEYAKHQTVIDLVNSEKVNNFLDKMKVIYKGKSHFEKVDSNIFEENYEKLMNEDRVSFVFAFDGSKTQIPLHTGYPGAEVGILKISQCFIQLDLMKAYEKSPFPHPKEYDDIFLNQSFEMTLPGFNVGSEEYPDPQDFFRYTMYSYLSENYNTFSDILKSRAPETSVFKPRTFLDSYVEMLIKRPGQGGGISCAHPCPHCRARSVSLRLNEFRTENLFDNGVALEYKIPCHCKDNPRDIFITDFLRFHEGFNHSGSNDGLYSQVMGFLEKIIFLNLLHVFEDYFGHEDVNPMLNECAFILDGPLALYNYAAWFSQSIADELIRLNEKNEILVVGVEKTGHFVDHLMDLNGVATPEDKELEPGMLFFLNDDYIKKFIKLTNNTDTYGAGAYFGKKLFYKNRKDHLFVINYAFNSLKDKLDDLNERNSSEYLSTQPRLADLVWILEKFSSSKYQNALSFVSMAHENASISSGYIGKRVIETFVQEKVNKSNNL